MYVLHGYPGNEKEQVTGMQSNRRGVRETGAQPGSSKFPHQLSLRTER